MKRRTSTLPVRVYRYGLLAPTEGAAVVEDQMWRAHRYKNALVAHERARRSAFREICAQDTLVADLDASLALLQHRIDEARKRMKAASARARKRVADPGGRALVARLAAEAKALRAERRAAVKGLRSPVKELVEAMQERAAVWAKAERAASGLYWGTYLAVEKAADQMCKSKSDPKFRGARPYSDQVGIDGLLAVQCQKGLAVAAIHGSDTRVRIAPMRPDAWSDRRMSTKRTVLKFRVGSVGREPLWAEFPILMHRPLPADGRITWVHVQRRRVGTRFRWECLFTVEAATLEKPSRLPSVTAAVDFGWRRTGDGLRIARAVTEDGDTEDLILPLSVVMRQRKPDDVRSIRDKHFDRMRPSLVAWLATHDHPDWLARDLAHLELWRSTARLTRVAYRWCDRRFDGDEEIFEAVDSWRRQDRHLYQWEQSSRSKAVGARRAHYRNVASQWAKRYPRIVITSKLDLSETAKRPEPGEIEDAEAAHVYRKEAAAGEFRAALVQAVRSSGGTVVIVDVPAQTCHACGGICDWDPSTTDHHTCEHCGVSWQCDDNMCQKLHAALASGEAA